MGLSMLRLRWVNRWDSRDKVLRLFRITWRRGRAGDGYGYGAKLTLALRPKVFAWLRSKDCAEVILTILGVRLHYQRSYGGFYA